MLIFVVQTFWLYIDDLAGKGLDFETIFKFLIYFTPKLVPIVLPLSILLASLMTFGTLAENYEFAAMKSSGISLIRGMSGLFIVHIMIGIGSYYFSNYVITAGEVKSFNLRRNLSKLKPAIAIREGVFNDLGQNEYQSETKTRNRGSLVGGSYYSRKNRRLQKPYCHKKLKKGELKK